MSTFSKLKESLNLKINPTDSTYINEDVDDVLAETTNKPTLISYDDWGFTKAGHLNGSHTGLLSCLALIREDHKQIVQKDENKQKRLKEPLLTKIKKANVQREDKEAKINLIETKEIPEIENSISNLKREINAIKKNPESVIPDKLSKVGFVVGLFILVALSIYLFVFYSSASFSAFFKVFSLSDIGVANSIFDPKAITEAFKDGITELILILSMPFVFIGLGFLIHQFQKEEGSKKYFQISALIIVTFIFDTILAYEITEKIYNIKALNSFQNIPEYNFNIAFTSVNFWLIIFAGFVVYIIWGLVFDFTIVSYDNLDVLKQELRTRESQISELKSKIDDRKNVISNLQKEITSLKELINEMQGKYNGILIDSTEFNKILHEFMGGWLHWMSVNKIDHQKIDEAKIKADSFMKIGIKEYTIKDRN